MVLVPIAAVMGREAGFNLAGSPVRHRDKQQTTLALALTLALRLTLTITARVNVDSAMSLICVLGMKEETRAPGGNPIKANP